jgi:hypothetical protein
MVGVLSSMNGFNFVVPWWMVTRYIVLGCVNTYWIWCELHVCCGLSHNCVLSWLNMVLYELFYGLLFVNCWIVCDLVCGTLLSSMQLSSTVRQHVKWSTNNLFVSKWMVYQQFVCLQVNYIVSGMSVGITCIHQRMYLLVNKRFSDKFVCWHNLYLPTHMSAGKRKI